MVVMLGVTGAVSFLAGNPRPSPSPSGTTVPAQPDLTRPTEPVPSLTGGTVPTAPPTQPTPSTETRPARRGATTRPGTALAVLAGLPVKGRAARTGYDRDQFGQAWLDTNRNGCDTRNDILARDLTNLEITPGTNGCRVEAGILADPYTGTLIHFVRGNDTVDIDHVVALSNAWQTGAFAWDVRKRAAFANDPLNLLAVDSSSNRQKGDADTATWLPPNKSYRCAYAARQVSVKAKYRLWVTGPERDAMARILTQCPDQPALTGGAPTLAPVAVNQPHRSTPSPPPGAGQDSQPGGSESYSNCDAVRAAGADPIYAGDPGYAARLDRDGDRTGCE